MAAQYGTAEDAKAMLEKAACRGEGEQGESTRYVQQGPRAALRTVISMSTAPTPQTASSRRIRRLRANS